MCAATQVGERIRVILDCDDNTLAFEKNYEFLGNAHTCVTLWLVQINMYQHFRLIYAITYCYIKYLQLLEWFHPSHTHCHCFMTYNIFLEYAIDGRCGATMDGRRNYFGFRLLRPCELKQKHWSTFLMLAVVFNVGNSFVTQFSQGKQKSRVVRVLVSIQSLIISNWALTIRTCHWSMTTPQEATCSDVNVLISGNGKITFMTYWLLSLWLCSSNAITIHVVGFKADTK